MLVTQAVNSQELLTYALRLWLGQAGMLVLQSLRQARRSPYKTDALLRLAHFSRIRQLLIALAERMSSR